MIHLENSPSFEQWKKIGIKPRHGIDVPLFALRTKNCCGIGEFFDLLPLIDWCTSVGFEIIQMLPLNDSGNSPAPYNAISSCALNPIYLSLHQLPGIEHQPSPTPLNSLPRVSYDDVQSFKMHFLHNYYEQEGKRLRSSPDFEAFVAKNAWLKPYALFKVIKDRLAQNNWMSWPEDLSFKNYDTLSIKHAQEMDFYMFLQYLCFMQFTEVKKYANAKGVLFKGDIPILISADSADTWSKPELFDFSLSAGAPPDQYNQEGQNWGFPLFNWEIVKQEHFNWWKQRLTSASSYYNLYRIDHVVGFFRIWAIALNHPAKEGKFLPENPDLWIPQGKEILEKMLAASSMLPIAEDLGEVPPSVRTCLSELGICGTKVMRWERKYHQNDEFIPIQDYPPLSMTTISTHDSETLAQWWKDHPEEAKPYAHAKHWTYTPELTFEERLDILRDAHHTPSLFHINLLQEYLALFPDLVWAHPEDERINVPGQVLPSNWTYRFKPTLEELSAHPQLKDALRKILS